MIPAFYGIDFRHDKLEVVCTEIGDAILFFGGRGDRCGLTYPQTEEAMAGIDSGFVWVGNPVHLRLTPLTVREGRHWIAEFQHEKRESRSPVTGRRVTETRQERVARQKLRDLAEISPKAAAREIRKLKKMSSLSEESVGLQGASPLSSGEKGRHRQDAVKRSDKYKAAKASKEKKTKADKAKGEKNGKCSQASTSGDRPSEKVLDRLRKQAQGREPSPSPPPSDNSSDGSEDDSGDDDSGSGQSGQDSGEETGSEQDPTDGDETSSGEESPRRRRKKKKKKEKREKRKPQRVKKPRKTRRGSDDEFLDERDASEKLSPPCFYGKDERGSTAYREWRYSIEIKRKSMSERRLKQRIRNTLRGLALDVLLGVERELGERAPVKSILAYLDNIYGHKMDWHQLSLELLGATQGDNEAVSHFFSRLRQIAEIIEDNYPKTFNKTQKKFTLRSSFFRGMWPELRSQLSYLENTDMALDAIVREAGLLEESARQIRASASVPYTQNPASKPKATSGLPYGDLYPRRKVRGWNPQVKSALLAEPESDPEPPAEELDEDHIQLGVRMAHEIAVFQAQTGLCYECDSPDHQVRNCPIRQAKQRKAKNGNTGPVQGGNRNPAKPAAVAKPRVPSDGAPQQ